MAGLESQGDHNPTVIARLNIDLSTSDQPDRLSTATSPVDTGIDENGTISVAPDGRHGYMVDTDATLSAVELRSGVKDPLIRICDLVDLDAARDCACPGPRPAGARAGR
ncbi:hypothetical protein [Streptomyces aureoversilis]|uniref:Uncharacterized protein n=1 Tax=Streptomyces aureoversilis TaxID=67277 RepID=A0ABV9ZSP0_9ACTN